MSWKTYINIDKSWVARRARFGNSIIKLVIECHRHLGQLVGQTSRSLVARAGKDKLKSWVEMPLRK